MVSITINGKTITSENCSNICITGDGIVINGSEVHSFSEDSKTINVTINGDVGSVRAPGSVTIKGNVGGTVEAGASIHCGDVGGNAQAGASIHCTEIKGSALAGSSIHNRKFW